MAAQAKEAKCDDANFLARQSEFQSICDENPILVHSNSLTRLSYEAVQELQRVLLPIITASVLFRSAKADPRAATRCASDSIMGMTALIRYARSRMNDIIDRIAEETTSQVDGLLDAACTPHGEIWTLSAQVSFK